MLVWTFTFVQKYPENAGNSVSGNLEFKIFRGSPPGPPSKLVPPALEPPYKNSWIRPSTQTSSVSPHQFLSHQQLCFQNSTKYVLLGLTFCMFCYYFDCSSAMLLCQFQMSKIIWTNSDWWEQLGWNLNTHRHFENATHKHFDHVLNYKCTSLEYE